MKENILDVLMYLFENFTDEDNPWHQDQESLKVELMEAGFTGNDVNRAFVWLEGLTERQDLSSNHYQGMVSIRVYSPQECERLDVECRGFLLFLEQLGVLDPINRELVVDRIMALETEELALEQLKWVVLMVLFNQPGQEAAFEWMENLVYDRTEGKLH